MKKNKIVLGLVAAGMLALGACTAQTPGPAPKSSAQPPASANPTASVAASGSFSGSVTSAGKPITPTVVAGNVAPGFTGVLTGTVSYKQRIALLPDVVVTVQLVDVSRADAPAIVLAEQVIKNPGQVPIKYELKYDASKINPNLTYAVQAKLTDAGGNLRWKNDTIYPALTRGAAQTGINVEVMQIQSSAQATPAPATTSILTGTVTYKPRIALLPDVVVTVQLVDVSRADAPAIVLAEQVIKNPGQVPIKYELKYDASKINPNLMYAVQARIVSTHGDLIWTNDTHIPALTRGAPQTGIEVEVVQAQPAPAGTVEPKTPTVPTLPITGAVSITGTASYAQKVALQPDSIASVVLYEMSASGVGIRAVARQTISITGELPATWKLAYDPAKIQAGKRYGVIVTVTSGKSEYRNSRPALVISGTGETASVDVAMRKVR